MKKTITVLIAGIFFICTANAQSTRFGFTAGTAFAGYKSDDAYSKAGITAGILADIPLGKNFSFQPALNFVQKGSKDEQTYSGITEKANLNVNSIELPLHLLYNTTGNIGRYFIGAGPSFTFSLSGKWKYEDGTNSDIEDVKLGDGDDDDMKGFDLGVNFLTGFCFPNGLSLSVNYNIGLSNLYPTPDPLYNSTLKSYYLGIKLGWLLNGKEKK